MVGRCVIEKLMLRVILEIYFKYNKNSLTVLKW